MIAILFLFCGIKVFEGFPDALLRRFSPARREPRKSR